MLGDEGVVGVRTVGARGWEEGRVGEWSQGFGRLGWLDGRQVLKC